MDDSKKKLSKPKRDRKRSKLPLLLIPLVFIVGIGAVFYFYSKVQNPLRGLKATDLDSVIIGSLAPADERGYPVHPQLWTNTIKNFQSTNVNWAPGVLRGIATIQFTDKNGKMIEAAVFKTDGEVGCFRINGVYYTGGNEPFVNRLLSDGQKATDYAPRQ